MLKRLNTNKKEKRLREETNEWLSASLAGDLEIISKFIRNNFDINSKNENGLTALHLASKEGHTDVIRELLKRGADVNSTTKRGNGALHMACVEGQLDGARILLENGANVNAQSETGFTPLYVAAQENHLDLVKFLLDHGANASLKTDDLFLPLDIALQQGNVEIVESLLESDPSNKASLPALLVAAKNNDFRSAKFLLENGYDVNRASPSGFTALHIGSRYGHFDICQLLIEKGADVNFKAKNDITALHVSSKEGRSALVDLLLSHGADPNSQTTEGLTALHCAAVGGHDQALDSLVRKGALLAAKTRTGLTPLHMALQGNQLSCTRQLLQHNAPIDDSSEDNLTPLHVAAHCGNLRASQILLDAGCDVNAKAKNGFSPLHVACKRNNREVIELLLQHKASLNQASDMGISPVHVAAFMGHADILTSLIQNGANLNAPTGGGMTPVYLAALANRTNVIELLLQKAAEVDARTAEQRTALHVASELGNSRDARLLLQHGASPHATASDEFLPLDFATTAGHEEIVQLLLDHGAERKEEEEEEEKEEGTTPEGKKKKKMHPPSSSSKASAVEEFSTVREAMRYIKDENDGLKTPVSKKPPSEFLRSSSSSSSSASRPKTFDRNSRLSHTQSTLLLLPGSPSVSFWSSFLADARGGEMIGCRHSGVRVILPPSKIPNPIGIRCRLIRKERLPFPPRLREGEGLACRALETAPAGSKFLGPVIFEVPHFASLQNEEREIVILRSDDGKSWTEHLSPELDQLEMDLKNSLLSDMRQQTNSLVNIVTVDLPHFFTLVSRIRMKQEEFSVDGGSLSATLTPKVKITFPPGSFKRKTKVGLQAQPVSQISASKALGVESVVGPIVTIEPLRRKFRSPVSVTMPLPVDEISSKDTRILCSLSDGRTEAVWEDISHLTPLSVVGDLASFTTSVSGKYWLLASPKVDLSEVQKLYSTVIPVPYFSRFVVFAKRLSASEGHLRVFCMTDDKVEKTLERQEQFVEVARSEDVEVFDGTAVYIHLEGNLLPLNSSSDDQLHLNFHAFRENRLPLAVRVVDPEEEASARVTFARDPGRSGILIPSESSEISALRVTLPGFDDGKSPEKTRFNSVFTADKPKVKEDEPGLLKAELRLADVAELIGENWKQVADHLGISRADVDLIESECDDATDRARAVLQQWMDENGSRANGNSLEKALRDLGMDDIITSCMINVADVTDAEEKATARNYLDAGVDPLKAELGSARDLWSSDGETLRHSLSPDDAYEEIQLRKAGILLPSEGRRISDGGNKSIAEETKTSRELFAFMDRSASSTVSMSTLTSLPSDGGGGGETKTLDQSTGEEEEEAEADDEEERTLEGGNSSVNRKARHLKPYKGSNDDNEEDVTVLPPGMTLPPEDDDDVMLDNSEELLDVNDVPLVVHKVTRALKATKAPPGEKDDSSQETSHRPSEDFSAASPSSSSSEGLLLSASLSGSSGPQQAPLCSRIQVEGGVPVFEEELTEEKSGQTFRSAPSQWKANRSRPLEAEGGDAQETIDEVEGICDSLLRKQPSTEVTCEVISQRDHETRVIGNLEFDPNAKVTSQDPPPKYPEDETPLMMSTSSENLSQNIRIPSTDLPAKDEQLQSSPMTESSYRYLDSGPPRDFLLEDAVTDEEQADSFQCKSVESSPQHEFLQKEPALMSGGRQTVTQESSCNDLDVHEEIDDAVSQDTESGHGGGGGGGGGAAAGGGGAGGAGGEGGGKPTSSIELESSGILREIIPHQSSAPEFTDKDCRSRSITESDRKHLDCYDGQSETIPEEETAENAEERRRSANDEERPLKSAPLTPQLKVLSRESEESEERHPTVESGYRYLDLGPEHNVTAAESATDDESDSVEGRGSTCKSLERGPTHAAALEDAPSNNYPEQEATQLEYENIDQETQLSEILPEELVAGHPLDRTLAYVKQSTSGETEAGAEVNECKQRDGFPTFPCEIIVDEGTDYKTVELKDDLPLSDFEEDDEIIGEEKLAEGTVIQFYELSPAQQLHESETSDAYDGGMQLLHDHLLFGQRTLEDEETTDRDMFKHSSVVLRRRVHKKTLLTAGCQEQTVVTEDTQVVQDNDAPEELHSAIQQIIEQFVHGRNSFVACYNAC